LPPLPPAWPEHGVKFLCDRCKTRYSIGDDRVRGKILKIRCKNCANVITVREGMIADPDAAPVPLEQPRVKKPTTGAPEALDELEARAREPARTDRGRGGEPGDRSSARRAAADDGGRGRAAGKRGQDDRRPEPVSALNAAFASAMAKPPPALEEEWYVSIDGEQEGPFSLAEAQHWVTQKPFEAELHCWSEGFDDWLPIDKVSHFRGLRKRPPPAVAPPPLPRIAGATPRPGAVPAPVAEDEPKPLFAATMASLERGAPAVSNPAIALPAAAPPARATPARGNPIEPRTNGVRNAAAPGAALDTRAPDARAGKPSGSSSPGRSKPISDAFDPGDSGAITQFGPVPPPEPFVKPRRDEPTGGRPDRAGSGPKHAFGEPGASAAPAELESGGDDHELAIGEVSRVVNLADIVRDRENATRRSGINPTFRSTGAIASMAAFGADGTPATQGAGEPGPAMPVAKSHRRGLITLFSVAVLMVLGVIGAVILLVTTEDDPIGGKLGPVHDIDTSRPEDPITHRPLGSGATTVQPNPLQRIIPRPRINPNPPVGSSQDPEPPPGNSLSPDEVEDMARKHQEITNRCYMRSQRGADSILIGEVKKISVTLTVDSEGTISDVKLSEHAADNLGKCLTMAIKGWRFRPSAGGTFRFSLAFVGS
jgi:predicted Zn finger-like uncharacterized protein